MRIGGRTYQEIAAAGGGIHSSVRRFRQTPRDAQLLFDAGYVRRMRSGEEAVRTLVGIQLDERSGIDHLLTETVVLGVGSVAEIDCIGLAKLGHVDNPTLQFFVSNIFGNSVLRHIGEKNGPKFR